MIHMGVKPKSTHQALTSYPNLSDLIFIQIPKSSTHHKILIIWAHINLVSEQIRS